MTACVLRSINVFLFGYAASKASECSSVPFGGSNTRSYVPGTLVIVNLGVDGIGQAVSMKCLVYDRKKRDHLASHSKV
jgi:hypothetical protein